MGKVDREKLNKIFGIDTGELSDMITVADVVERYFDNNKGRAAKSVGRVTERVLSYPSEGGLVLTMEDHAGLYMFIAAAQEMANEADRKLAYIGMIAEADHLEDAMTAIVTAQLMELIK